MVRISFSFYFFLLVILQNLGMALNIWHGFHLPIQTYLVFVIRVSWPYLLELGAIWAGSVWVERNRVLREMTLDSHENAA
jgi:hypothetical protein